jgi:sugar (pentulose or hexulose) kinase
MRKERILNLGSAIIVDIGKTHSKVSLWTRAGTMLDRQVRANEVQDCGDYHTLDVSGISAWLLDALAHYAGHPIEAIIPVAHGAGVAALADGALAFPPLDYEAAIPGAAMAAYCTQRDPFALTGSPALPAGLNIGSQLHWLEAVHGDTFRKATLLPWAQFWAWFLCGEARSEVTSLGCHSDLWSPAESDYSPMAKQRGWAQQFAPLAKAGDAIGTLRLWIAAQTGLPASASIHCGLHDSNAALHAARAFPAIVGKEATILSTGTWFIAMRLPAAPIDASSLPEARDCLVNVDAFGQPVPSARFMGGRENELLGARIDRAGTQGLDAVLANGAMVLPSQVPGTGPFPDAVASWINEPPNPDERIAAIALYAALMTDAALNLIGSRECLLIEGRFAASEIFTRALAALRPETQVFIASAEADASFGALRLIDPALKPPGDLRLVPPLATNVISYHASWLANITPKP